MWSYHHQGHAIHCYAQRLVWSYHHQGHAIHCYTQRSCSTLISHGPKLTFPFLLLCATLFTSQLIIKDLMRPSNLYFTTSIRTKLEPPGTYPDEIKSSNLPGMLCLLVAEPVGDIRYPWQLLYLRIGYVGYLHARNIIEKHNKLWRHQTYLIRNYLYCVQQIASPHAFRLIVMSLNLKMLNFLVLTYFLYRQIVCGLFDQKIRLEFGADKGVIAIVTRDVQVCLNRISFFVQKVRHHLWLCGVHQYLSLSNIQCFRRRVW